MATLTRHAVGPLGHERRHQAMALREDFGKGLEERGAVGRFERIAIGESCFENAGTGFGVQALDWKSHGLAEIKELMAEIGMHGTAQHRVAESAGSQRLQ